MSSFNGLRAQNPREIAARALERRRAGGEFTEDILEAALDKAGLSPSDRGLCQEIVCGVVRWRETLDWLIGRKSGGRNQKPGLSDLLQMGLYQIFWLDRIPNHAAVNETVKLAKLGGFGAQAGFVNAVLRGYIREADETRRLLESLKTSQPALAYSHPEWLVARWEKRWGLARTLELLEWNNTPPRIYARANTLRSVTQETPPQQRPSPTPQVASGTPIMGRSSNSALPPRPAPDSGSQTPETPAPEEQFLTALVERWRMENVEYDFRAWDWTGENLVFLLKSHPPIGSLGSFRDGWFYVQDPSTLLAARELEPRPGETILDVCAAPGGKATFIAQLMKNQGRVVARELSSDRLKLLTENCARLGASCVEPTRFSPGQALDATLARSAGPPFDKVIVDAPCSNTGVIRRRVDLRWRIEPKEIQRLRGLQLDLLRQAAKEVRPGGLLVYSTCSLEPEENGGVVSEFLGENGDFRLQRERELLPFKEGVDGAYVARMRRSVAGDPGRTGFNRG